MICKNNYSNNKKENEKISKLWKTARKLDKNSSVHDYQTISLVIPYGWTLYHNGKQFHTGYVNIQDTPVLVCVPIVVRVILPKEIRFTYVVISKQKAFPLVGLKKNQANNIVDHFLKYIYIYNIYSWKMIFDTLKNFPWENYFPWSNLSFSNSEINLKLDFLLVKYHVF